jgi:hypothetical protein
MRMYRPGAQVVSAVARAASVPIVAVKSPRMLRVHVLIRNVELNDYISIDRYKRVVQRYEKRTRREPSQRGIIRLYR